MPLTNVGQEYLEKALAELLSVQILRQADKGRTVTIGPAPHPTRIRVQVTQPSNSSFREDRWSIRELSLHEIEMHKSDLLAVTVQQLGEELDAKTLTPPTI